MESLGQRLRHLRELRGFRQEDVAAQAHVDKSTISLYESDARTPSTPMMLKLAAILNTTVSYLLGESLDGPASEVMPPENWRQEIEKTLRRAGWSEGRIRLALRVLEAAVEN